MNIELSSIVNWLLVAFIGFVFVMWFVTKVKDIWKGKPLKIEEPPKPEEKKVT
jgi:large-conductance mechanosensitive channel